MDEQQSFAALHQWFLTPQGQDLARACAAELKTAQIGLQGKYLLQLGDCASNAWLKRLSYQSTWILSPDCSERSNRIVSSMHHMPLERESIDCIIAPLTLEICGQTGRLVDELDRILKPMGYLIFFGVNPWSFWGASLKWGRLSCFAQASAWLSSSLSLKHAMQARGYEQCWLSSFYYLPPIGSEYWLRKLEFLNQMSKMVWPYPAGFYCLILQKQDPCMTITSTGGHTWNLAEMNSI